MSCWSCGHPTTPFYELSGVPAGSCVLLGDAAAAAAYPTGDIRLSHCTTCGLVQNDAFDESLVDYLSGYEASQAFSPTFASFAERLVDGLIERYGLSGARVLEPGCGDGAFLALVVERTGGTGLGLDPAHVAGRLTGIAGDRLEFRRELFTPTTSEAADLIVCRHTLEHIRDVESFMVSTARAAGETDGAVVMFEVPEATRIFESGAFWDVYYEHSVYFSPTSVTNLFRRHGLQPQRVALEFDGQYIIIEAQAGEPSPGLAHDPVMAGAVATFADQVEKQVTHWQELLAKASRPVVWGASSKAVGFMAAVPGVSHAVDINPHKHGSYLAGSGVPVIGPAQLAAVAPDLVVVMNPIYENEVRAMVLAEGLHPELVAL